MTLPASPARRYAAFRARPPALTAFQALYDFEFDPFQVQACEALDGGRGVLVAAPTGSGKTVVGEFAVHLAMAGGRKCFYTTPIKALSNQKYADLVRRYGPDKVGLLTGDNSVNGEAPVVVMTTEVLRNMLYAGSATLSGLGYVVLDEVHYLADRFRGAVWEEVIIHLPESVQVVALSATVSNAEEFGEWLDQVRGGTAVIVDEHRPVPLWQHMLAAHRLYDLFAETGGEARVNPELIRIAQRDEWAERKAPSRPGRGGQARAPGHRPRRFAVPRPSASARRPEVIERLDRAGLLPAITFIFSRAGCDAAAAQCVAAGLRLTTPEEADEITALAERRTADIGDEDLCALGYGEWLTGLQRGIAAHHAGLLPTFKEVVEELFEAGLIRAVFATETLALGINMPARTVVIERLDKWNGETHANLTPGEYTQLTGRAGRRGIDVEGHAVVLWQPGVDPVAVAGLAGTRTYPLTSSFRPSYNMAVNLTHQFGRARAATLLESSFAQFQADRAVVGLARQIRRGREELDQIAAEMTCDRGDVAEYARLRGELSEREGQLARERSVARRADTARSLEALRRGDIIQVTGGRRAGTAVVLQQRPPDGLVVLTSGRQVRRLTAADFTGPVEPVDAIRIPAWFSERSPKHRRDLSVTVRDRLAGRDLPRPRRAADTTDEQVAALRQRLREHPSHACPDREQHIRLADRHRKLEREVEGLERRVAGRTHLIARTFRQVCAVLDRLGYLSGDAVTAEGQRLAGLYTELDLVVAECLRRGLWAGLGPAELAACVSALSFEPRRDDAGPPRLPPGRVRDVLGAMARVWAELDQLEKDNRLSFLREPDAGFAWTCYRWAKGDELQDVLDDAPDVAAGDFVRWTKQVIDLLDQVAAVAGGDVAAAARSAAGSMRRGVIAYTSVG